MLYNVIWHNLWHTFSSVRIWEYMYVYKICVCHYNWRNTYPPRTGTICTSGLARYSRGVISESVPEYARYSVGLSVIDSFPIKLPVAAYVISSVSNSRRVLSKADVHDSYTSAGNVAPVPDMSSGLSSHRTRTMWHIMVITWIVSLSGHSFA